MSQGDAELRRFTGRTIAGRYLLREWLGGGAFGGVFRSEQQVLGVAMRRVAIKVSRRGGMTEETARDLFADVLLLAEAMDGMTDSEARRHLVHVYDGGVAADAGDRAYLAMEFVPGTTLGAQFASYRRVPAALLIRWAQQICVALRGLHGLVPPMLHRDLKPDNVLLGTDRTVRLVDFGLAVRLVGLGHVPGVAGTIAYMAPETSQGETVPASDIYSLGVLLYEGLTGEHPFRHIVPPTTLPAALHGEWLYDAKRRTRAVPPSSLNSTVTPKLDAVVLRCLEVDPRHRFGTAAELLEALSQPNGSRPSTPDETVLVQARRLQSEGDLPGARQALERGVAAGATSPAERFALLCELGEVLDTSDDPEAAAERFAAAWDLTAETTLLRSRDERCHLLTRCAETFRRAGNTYQAGRFDHLFRRERGGR
jgi:serine/threonine protein kinase